MAGLQISPTLAYGSGLEYSTGLFAGSGLIKTGTWNPGNLGANLYAWWDPSDATTIFQDSSETVPITASGQSLGALKDKGTNGFDLLQATAGSKPTWNKSAGLSYIQGNGSSSIILAANNYGPLGDFTFAVAFQFVSGQAASARLLDGSFPNFYTGTDASTETTAGAGVNETGAAPFGQFFAVSNGVHYVLSGKYNSSTGVTSAQINKGSPTTRTQNSGTISGTFAMLAAPAGGSNSSFPIYGAVIAKTQLGSSDYNNLITYLGAKSGLSI